jgi:hypothetical protein
VTGPAPATGLVPAALRTAVVATGVPGDRVVAIGVPAAARVATEAGPVDARAVATGAGPVDARAVATGAGPVDGRLGVSGAGRRVADRAATGAVRLAGAPEADTPAGVAPGVGIAVRAPQAAATPVAAAVVLPADVLAVAMRTAGAADTRAVAAAGDMTEARVAGVVSGSARAAVRGAKRLPTVRRADPTVRVGIRDVRAAVATRVALAGAGADTRVVLLARAVATKVGRVPAGAGTRVALGGAAADTRVVLLARAVATKVVLLARAVATKVVPVPAAGPPAAAAIRVGRAAAVTKAVRTPPAAAAIRVGRAPVDTKAAQAAVAIRAVPPAVAADTRAAQVAADTRAAQAAADIRADPPAAAAGTKAARAADIRVVPRVAPRSAPTPRHSQLAATEPSEVDTAAKGAPAVGFNGLTVRDPDHRGARMALCGVGSPEAVAVIETATQDHGSLPVGVRGAMTMTRTSVRGGQAVRQPPQRASAVTSAAGNRSAGLPQPVATSGTHHQEVARQALNGVSSSGHRTLSGASRSKAVRQSGSCWQRGADMSAKSG